MIIFNLVIYKITSVYFILEISYYLYLYRYKNLQIIFNVTSDYLIYKITRKLYSLTAPENALYLVL